MGDIANIEKSVADVCKGEDKKSDAMMLMSPDSNWDQFLTPAPCAIALLGDLILISAETDFSLEEKPPKDGFKLLRYPGSFRASLVQVSNAGWSAFNEAHTSMDQIRLHTGNVDAHVKNAVRFLMQGTQVEVEQMLPMSLGKIQDIANESLRLAKAIEERFIGVMELTGELLEACTNTKGRYDEKTKETEIALHIAKTERESRQKEIEASERRLANMDKEVKEAQQDFKDAMNTVPSSASLFVIAAGEALIDGVRNITSIPKLVKGVVKRKIEKVLQYDFSTDKIDDNYYTKEMSKQRIYDKVPIITKNINMLIEIANGSNCNNPSPDWDRILGDDLKLVCQYLKTSRSHVSKETAGGDLCQRVLKLCDEAISICNTLSKLSKSIAAENRDDIILEVIARANILTTESQTLEAEASKSSGKNPLDNKSPHLSKMPTESASASAVKAASENARFKTELAKETLKDAKRRQEKAADELRESNERLTQVLRDMAKLDLTKIDFDTIRETLVKGIKALAEVREQWGKLVRFFQMLSNLIKCCLHSSLTDFVDQASKGRTIKMADHTVPLSNIFRDVIFEQASKASQIAHVVRTIAGTYVQISNDHLMDRITCLGRLVALDPKKDEHEITRKRLELYDGCQEAQRAIRDIIIREKEAFNRKIDERMNQIIAMEKTLPAIEPQREKEIKESVSSGMKISDKELADLI